MNTLVTPALQPARPRAPAPLLWQFVRMEFLKLLRQPSFSIPALLFPTLFFAMFGWTQVPQRLGGLDGGLYMLVAYASYAVMSVAMFAFSVTLAVERSLGWHRLLRATPLPAGAMFGAKSLVTAGFAMTSLAVLLAFMALAAGVRMPADVAAPLLAGLLLGLLPFCAFGIALGYLLGPSSVVGVANALFLCLAFCSGIFVPFPALPAAVQSLAPWLPSYHLVRMGWNLAGGQSMWLQGVHVACLLGWAVSGFALARLAYQRNGARRSA